MNGNRYFFKKIQVYCLLSFLVIIIILYISY